MDLDIMHIPSTANEWDVTRSIAEVLHSEDFTAILMIADERPTNFRVKLNDSNLGGVRNNSTGTLTLPTARIGNEFQRYIRNNPIRVLGKKLKFIQCKELPAKGLALTLEKTPYINPDIEEERQRKIHQLQDPLRIDEVQFGVYYRTYPKTQTVTATKYVPPRAYSVECKLNYTVRGEGWLRFEYDSKLIRIELGDRAREQVGKSIAMNFPSINKLFVGYDGNPFLCFDTLTPPVLEEFDFNRPTTGHEWKDNKKYRRRIGSLHPSHGAIATYAHQLRIILYHDVTIDVVRKFMDLCKVVGLSEPINCEKYKISIDAGAKRFFEPRRLFHIKNWLLRLNWRVAFQLEAVLHNALLNTEDLLNDLRLPIDNLCKKHPKQAGDVLRHFQEALRSRHPQESPVSCFNRIRERTLNAPATELDPGLFLCHHVTFTPTRMILEGPYATQSNRVIRKYEGYVENFLRVDFRDEDRLQYRWAREVDGASYLNERVGGILKGGFELAGRRFEFLAYSSSALREHAVWFMHPFQHPDYGTVTSAAVRHSLGNFEGVIREPSKYAARMAQAFTATSPSVTIRRDQWMEIPDIGTKEERGVFTDGVGTISKELGDMIWQECCRRDRQRRIRPAVYQIRFLGYKGVVGVDEQLQGIKMCLRPSMNKFRGNEEEKSQIEIARAFESPGKSYLNRAMIMILEDRGVRKDRFLELQNMAVADARMVDYSLEQFRKVLVTHSLGAKFHLSSLMKRLIELGIDLHDRDNAAILRDPFHARLRRVAMNHILRDIKHHARIPLPRSHQLVGIADEGPAYIAAGHQNVFTLEQGQVYACIQNPGDPEPTYIKGQCMISRSPVVHPGDIQRVHAIGVPPPGKLCLFRHIKNAVVFASKGVRPLPDCLGGGDLDGDTYDLVQYPELLAPDHEESAEYTSLGTRKIDRESTVDDICDFIVEYINSDVLGLLSIRHLIIADQSKHGTKDEACLQLAKLCSQAVDYPKNGIAVDLQTNPLPATLIRPKPDWHSAEVEMPRGTDYYESSRALGELFRGITLADTAEISTDGAIVDPSRDPITIALEPYIKRQVLSGLEAQEADKALFLNYTDELKYVCVTHTLTNQAGVQLLEEEVVIGTILAKCSQKRWRSDRIYRMQLHSSVLVQRVHSDLLKHPENASMDELQQGLARAWRAWNVSVRHKPDFGSSSYGLIALDVIFNCLDRLGEFGGTK